MPASRFRELSTGADRSQAGLPSGALCLLPGIGGDAVASLFATFATEPRVFLAGLALLSTTANSLYTALADGGVTESAVITCVATASSLNLFRTEAAFWGLVAAGIATLAFKTGARKT